LDVKRLFVLICVVVCSSSALGAINLSMGGPVFFASRSDAVGAAVRTDIDLYNPAQASGRIERVEFRWTATCTAAAKVKFFRRVGNTLTLVAERGPFNTSGTETTAITLSPPVDVVYGDLIGITRVADCGSPMSGDSSPVGAARYAQFAGDVSGSFDLGSGTEFSGWIIVFGEGTGTEYVDSVIPVVGSLRGAAGSFFRTQLQLLLNSGALGATTFRLVYHPAGVAGRTTDPSVNVTLGRGASQTLEDFAAVFGGGLGSLDVVVTGGEIGTPIVVANVYNDEGEAGTSSLVQEAVSVRGNFGNGALLDFPGQFGYLFVPADRTQFRTNIGVRSLQQGATLKVRVLSSAGTELFATEKNYTATFFEQVALDSFLGFAAPPGSILEISLQRGSAIVYGATTDNRTNDPRLQFLRPVFPEG
jgi:hypothetical protein